MIGTFAVLWKPGRKDYRSHGSGVDIHILDKPADEELLTSMIAVADRQLCVGVEMKQRLIDCSPSLLTKKC
jgi:hypothetical protein